MPVFKFRGIDHDGSSLAGKEYAEDKYALANELRRRGVFPVSITKRSVGSQLPGLTNNRDLSLFTKQFSVMLGAGLPLVQSLTVLIQQQEDEAFETTLIQVRADVEGGVSLAEAFRRHPDFFSRMFTDMIEAAELGGFLEVAFNRLSIYLKRAAKIKRQALSASAYPLVVMAVALVTVSLTLVWVVPVFVSMFQVLNVPLPLLTRVVIVASEWSSKFSIPLVLLLVGGVIGLRQFRERPMGQLMTDRLLLGIPLFGKVLRKIALARFALTLATLLRSGIPLLEGLDITAATSGNCVFRDALRLVQKEVLKGRAVFEPMEELGVFPPLVTRMIAVGEQAGELVQMLEHLSIFYEEESEAAVSQMMAALEPTLVVLLGVLVGGIVISLYLPIFSLVGHFAH